MQFQLLHNVFRSCLLISGYCMQGAVYTMKFNPQGTAIASGSHDKDICELHVHFVLCYFGWDKIWKPIYRIFESPLWNFRWSVHKFSGSHQKNCWHKLTWLSWDVVAVLWNVQGDCDNYMVLKGHRNAVLDLCWTTDGQHIISASPDKTVRAWDAMTGKQVCCSVSSHNCC